MKIIFYLFVLCVQVINFGFAQDSLNYEQQYLAEYEKNIKLEKIDGIYIPKDLDDCFVELSRLSDPAKLEEFRNADKEEVYTKLHFGLGRWISSKWKFYEGSRFSHYLKSLGISHPDDMVQFTIVSFHRHLNGVELEIKKRADFYRGMRKKELDEKMKKGKVIKRDTIKRGKNEKSP